MTVTHTHHFFSEEVPCDLPDTYEAHYGPTLAACPTCGDCAGTFIRTVDGLVCKVCA